MNSSVLNRIKNKKSNTNDNIWTSSEYTLNFGPQHPAAHGVLRLILELEGELVIKADPHVGLLHRGTEKLIEHRTYLQSVPYFDRLDYVSTMSQEHAYCLGVERLSKVKLSSWDKIYRILLLEITRILNHLLAISCHALDVGAMTPFLWAFEDREKLMTFYEQISGARLHSAHIRPGVSLLPSDVSDLSYSLLNIKNFMVKFPDRINKLERMLSGNRIWKQRLVNVGTVSTLEAFDWGFTGVMLRGSNCCWDLRYNTPYSLYNTFSFKIPTGKFGDCYDRYLIRIQEMKESTKVSLQVIDRLYLYFNKSVNSNNISTEQPHRSISKNSMEGLINHFKYWTENTYISSNSHLYTAVEAPKGEFGVYLVSNRSNTPYRCKIRAPGFYHLQGLNLMSVNHLLADVVTIIGTQDIVFGEVDR